MARAFKMRRSRQREVAAVERLGVTSSRQLYGRTQAATVLAAT